MRLLQDYLDVFARQQLVGGLKGYSAWAGQSDEMLLARGRYLLTRVDDDMISTMLQSDEWLAPQAALYLAAILKRTAFVPALRERLAAATNPVVEGVYVAAVVLFNQRKLLAELGAGMDELAEFAMKLIRELPSPNTPRKYRRILNEPLRWGRQLRGAGDPTDLAAFQQDLAAEVLATTPPLAAASGVFRPPGVPAPEEVSDTVTRCVDFALNNLTSTSLRAASDAVAVCDAPLDLLNALDLDIYVRLSAEFVETMYQRLYELLPASYQLYEQHAMSLVIRGAAESTRARALYKEAEAIRRWWAE